MPKTAMPLAEYVNLHMRRLDDDEAADESTVDMILWKAQPTARKTSADEFRAIARAHQAVDAPCEILDGAWHDHIEIGLWIGDENLALPLMALGQSVGALELDIPTSDVERREDVSEVEWRKMVREDLVGRVLSGRLLAKAAAVKA